jgi:hypothetical protein
MKISRVAAFTVLSFTLSQSSWAESAPDVRPGQRVRLTLKQCVGCLRLHEGKIEEVDSSSITMRTPMGPERFSLDEIERMEVYGKKHRVLTTALGAAAGWMIVAMVHLTPKTCGTDLSQCDEPAIVRRANIGAAAGAVIGFIGAEGAWKSVSLPRGAKLEVGAGPALGVGPGLGVGLKVSF